MPSPIARPANTVTVVKTAVRAKAAKKAGSENALA